MAKIACVLAPVRRAASLSAEAGRGHWEVSFHTAAAVKKFHQGIATLAAGCDCDCERSTKCDPLGDQRLSDVKH